MAVNICQAAFDPVVVVGQFFVIDPHEVEHGCVEVVPMNRIFNRLPSDLIGLPIAVPGLHAAAGNPA